MEEPFFDLKKDTSPGVKYLNNNDIIKLKSFSNMFEDIKSEQKLQAHKKDSMTS